MKKNRREFNVTQIGNLFYLTLKSRVKRFDFYLDKGKIIIRDDPFGQFEGEKVYATNDQTINVAKLPTILLTKLDYTKTEILTLKVEEYNLRPEIIGGTWDYGSYEYDIRPVVDKNNCIIVDMWKL